MLFFVLECCLRGGTLVSLFLVVFGLRLGMARLEVDSQASEGR